MKFWDNIKTIRKHERLRREWLAKQASESPVAPKVTRGTGAPLHGRVETDSGRLARLYEALVNADDDVRALRDENMRLKAANADLSRKVTNLKSTMRTLKVRQHNDFLEWLAEPENFNLMMHQRPDLMRRLMDTIEDCTPIPSSVYPR